MSHEPKLRLSDIPVHWGTTDWYEMALRWEVYDHRAALRALAMVDAAYLISTETGVDFSTVCDMILLGMIQHADLYIWGDAWTWRLKIGLLTEWRSWRWLCRMAWRAASARIAASSTKSKRHGLRAFAGLMAAFKCTARIAPAGWRRKGIADADADDDFN